MPLYDPVASRFANAPLEPWQVTKALFDFDSGFVSWIQKYLEARKLPFDVASAKQWINKFKFEQERYELCTLQWQEYQASLVRSKPTIRTVASDCGVSDGVDGDTGESDVDRAVDAVNLPDEFRKLEGETAQEYRDRMMAIAKAKMSKMSANMSFGK